MYKSQWYLNHQDNVPDDYFIDQVQAITNKKQCQYLAQILWNRDIKNTQQLDFLLSTNKYQPTSYLAFGKEIQLAIQRLEKARIKTEKVSIWGDWQVDGMMSTCILWENLRQFFSQKNQLSYYFPDRFLPHFGLNCQGIDQLAQQGITLIVVADTGSHNLDEISYAQSLGIDIIIIDHPPSSLQRPAVVAWLNSHNLPISHPFYHFSSVAIAYKLVEGLAKEFPAYFTESITKSLDLVALGLLADTVNLQGDARYLVREGIKLIKEKKRHNINILANNCFEIGDRALDNSYGLTNRMRAISCVYTDAYLAINLFTSNNISLRTRLADQAEKAYFNCLDLLAKILKEARKKLQNLDLSNTTTILLTDSQWHPGILSLAAKIICTKWFQ